MNTRVEMPERFEDLAEIEGVLLEYLRVVRETLIADGGPSFDLEQAAQDTLGNIGAYLPPVGRTYIVRDASGAILATAFLRLTSPGAAEIKRLYVRPAGRGNGIARNLTLRAMSEAKEIGANRIVLDSMRGFSEARKLYESLGFEYVARYAESEIPKELDQWSVYMEREL